MSLVRQFDTGYHIGMGVTQSILGDFKDCRVMCQNKLNGYSKEGDERDALFVGAIAHYCLEQYYKNGMVHGKQSVLYDIYEYLENESIDIAALPQKKQDLLHTIWVLVDEYIAYWHSYRGRYSDRNIKWVALEEEFDVDFQGFRLRGKRDGIIRVKGKPWLFETKFLSSLESESTLDALAMDFQSLFYLVATEVERGIEIEGVLYNVIRKPQIRFSNRTAEQYRDAVIKSIKKDKESYFGRWEVKFSRGDIDSFKGRLLDDLHAFSKWIGGVFDTYRNEHSCRGRWVCEYLRACSQRSFVGYNQERQLFQELPNASETHQSESAEEDVTPKDSPPSGARKAQVRRRPIAPRSKTKKS